jgi:manganese transport protein
MLSAVAVIFFITSPFDGLIYSRMLLGIQLPVTIFLQIYLTSSERVMGKFANKRTDKILLWAIGSVMTVLNVMLLLSYVVK